LKHLATIIQFAWVYVAAFSVIDLYYALWWHY